MKCFSSFLFAVLLWSLLILRWGYRFGTGDQVELLPYALFLNDPSLYPHDFFIQGLHHSVPNERTVMATLLAPFANHLEVVCFLLHFISTVVLIMGLVTLASRYIRSKYLAWLAVLIALLPLHDFALGNVDLYSDCFQSSLLAVAIIAWALVAFLDKRFVTTSLLLAAATFFQLLDGLVMMMTLTSVLVLQTVQGKHLYATLLRFNVLYAGTAGIYLLFILVQKSQTADISNVELFNILFDFRHPHHFIFVQFPKFRMLVFLLLTVAAWVYFKRNSSEVFQIVAIGMIGVALYAIAVDVFHLVFIGNFQFYKITPWIKLLGVVAMFAYLENLIRASFIKSIQEKAALALLSAGFLFCWVIILSFSRLLPYQVPYEMLSLSDKDELIEICRNVRSATDKNAVFIQPFDNTALKFYSQRSSYVDFKANVRNKLFVKEWSKRIDEVYNISSENKEKGFALESSANRYFYHLSIQSLLNLKNKGVTHILTKKEFPPSVGKLILSNSTYAVYQL